MKTRKTTLVSALFPLIRQRVLGLLLGKPDSTFHTNEIIRFANAGHGAVQRELVKLSEAKLITVQSLGNQKRYQANSASPIFPDLRNIILKTSGLADIVRDAIRPLSRQIQCAFIYGSIAKGEDNAKSDVDLLVISETLSYADIFPLLEKAQKILLRQINPTFYSKTEWRTKQKNKNHFVCSVLKKPKIFLMGTQDGLKKL